MRRDLRRNGSGRLGMIGGSGWGRNLDLRLQASVLAGRYYARGLLPWVRCWPLYDRHSNKPRTCRLVLPSNCRDFALVGKNQPRLCLLIRHGSHVWHWRSSFCSSLSILRCAQLMQPSQQPPSSVATSLGPAKPRLKSGKTFRTSVRRASSFPFLG